MKPIPYSMVESTEGTRETSLNDSSVLIKPDDGLLKTQGTFRKTSGFRGRSKKVVAALALAIVFAYTLVFWLYPLSLPYTFGYSPECVDVCVEESERSMRSMGLLVLLPFTTLGLLSFWFGRSRRSARVAVWCVLGGAYLGFFAGMFAL